MSPVSSLAVDERLSVLHEELAELTGQRNAIDARIVEIAAEIDRDELWAAAGARSTAGWLAWKTGVSPSRAQTIAGIAHRYDEFPQCIEGLREGRFSLDQVGVIAERGLPGSDEHFATMARCATVSQLRTALKMQPKPTPEPQPRPDDEDDDSGEVVDPGPQVSITSTSDEQYTYWRIALPHVENAAFDAALASHRDALVTEWKAGDPDGRASMPNTAAAFLRLVEASWDAEAAARPHGQRTTVVVHVDTADKIAALHLGPVLGDADRRYLTCDATCEVWFHRDGQ
ncbi:MAG: DUF222 domain-containing protein, partial [Actinomycetota bacterium]